MNLSQKQLKRIVAEELEKVLKEDVGAVQSMVTIFGQFADELFNPQFWRNMIGSINALKFGKQRLEARFLEVKFFNLFQIIGDLLGDEGWKNVIEVGSKGRRKGGRKTYTKPKTIKIQPIKLCEKSRNKLNKMFEKIKKLAYQIEDESVQSQFIYEALEIVGNNVDGLTKELKGLKDCWEEVSRNKNISLDNVKCAGVDENGKSFVRIKGGATLFIPKLKKTAQVTDQTDLPCNQLQNIIQEKLKDKTK